MKYASMKRALLPGMLAVALAPTAQASDDIDQSTAREMVERGEIMSVEDIRAGEPERLGGDLLDLELEKKRGGYVYELKIKDSDGHVREFYVDAATGEIIKEEREDD